MKNNNKKLQISIFLNLILLALIIVLSLKYNIVGNLISKLSSNNTKVSILDNQYYINKNSTFNVMADTTNEVIFLGDSITDNAEWREFFNDVNVKNRGISGDTTEGVLNRLDEVVKSKPLKIFLMIGINDIGDGLSTDLILNNYKKIVSIIKDKSPSTKLYIQSVLPCNSKLMIKDDRNARRNVTNISNLNKQLLELSLNENIKYIELNNEFKDSNGELVERLSLDGVHINGEAYLMWKNIINEYVYE